MEFVMWELSFFLSEEYVILCRISLVDIFEIVILGEN